MRGINTNHGVGDSLGSHLKMRRGSEMCLLIRAKKGGSQCEKLRPNRERRMFDG